MQSKKVRGREGEGEGESKGEGEGKKNFQPAEATQDYLSSVLPSRPLQGEPSAFSSSHQNILHIKHALMSHN